MSDEIINLPATYTVTEEVDGETIETTYTTTVTATLKDNTIDETEKLIESLPYLPPFLQEKPVMKDAAKILDACISDNSEELAEIKAAYFDTLYKLPGYMNLSYGAKLALLKEKGFDYMVDLLSHMYDEEYESLSDEEQKVYTYEEYVELKCDEKLTNILSLFNLLYILKGKTLGLELAFNLIDMPSFLYITWDIIANYKGEWDGDVEDLPLPGGDIEVEKGDVYAIVTDSVSAYYIFNGVAWHYVEDYNTYTSPREAFTATLLVYGVGSTDLQERIAEFVRNYMLPYIEVTLQFTGSFDAIYCYPNGSYMLLNTLLLYNYYEDDGTHVIHNLDHDVPETICWNYVETMDYETIYLGWNPDTENGFADGSFDLTKSYIIDADGNTIQLYGDSITVCDLLTGDATERYDDNLEVSDFGDDNEDFVSAPLEITVLVDIETGDQVNPYYTTDEDGNEVFERDPIIKFYKYLTIDGIHLAKTVDETEELTVEEISGIETSDLEVYAGRVTIVTAESGGSTMSFEYSDPDVRTEVGTEDVIHLVYSDATVNEDLYSGIGDLGILGTNEYFIYNGMLWWNSSDGFVQIGEDNTWTDVGATHATSTQYYTPAINNNALYCLKDGVATLIDDTLNWTIITGYVSSAYYGFGVADGILYLLSYDEDNLISYTVLDEETEWTYITGVAYEETYEGYGIKNEILYRLTTEGVTEVTLDGETLSGWDSSFDCISRYHHNNDKYTTYGICNGYLYYINNDTVGLIEATGTTTNGWTRVCGYYNDDSPRTYGYAINEGKLYNLIGTTAELRNEEMYWVEISGCATTTNTYILGIAYESSEDTSGYLYKINASKLEKLYDTTGWTKVCGRYSESTAASGVCYGYAIRNGKYFILDEDLTVCSGGWKLNGEGAIVDLTDYNITNVTVTLSDGTVLEGEDAIKSYVPTDDLGDTSSDYDIYVTYETIGFEDNTRYIIKVTKTNTYYTYINPEETRDNIYMDNVLSFDEDTGYIDDFIEYNVTSIGHVQINGAGEAYRFPEDGTYIEMPQDTECDTILIKMGAVITTDEELYQAIYGTDGISGICYGYYNGTYGIFAKTISNEESIYTTLLSVEPEYNATIYLQFVSNGDYWDLNISLDGSTYYIMHTSTSDNILYRPFYLGGNGTDFADCIFYLAQSYFELDGTQTVFYKNGYYISVDSLGMDIMEVLHTRFNQNAQEVIKIFTEDGEEIITLGMNDLYVSRTAEVTVGDNIEITNDSFTYNTLNIGYNEGTTTSTLTFSGNYTLDPLKASDVGEIQSLSQYNITTIANSFDEDNHLLINPDYLTQENPLVITTGTIEEAQYLFVTEEDSAFTNQYLLTSTIEATYSGETLDIAAVPSGEVYEIVSDEPGTVTKTIVYNAEAFEIDETLVSGDFDNFDSYNATLTFGQDISAMLVTLDYDNGTTLDDNSVDCLPVISFSLNSAVITSAILFDDEYYSFGNLVETETENDDGETETTYEVDEGVEYDWQTNTQYYLKFNITREDNGVNTDVVTVSETDSEEEKDKLQYTNGVVSNFSPWNYFTVADLTSCYGLVLNITTNDDTSIDQGLFGYPDSDSVCLKDGYIGICDSDNNVTKSEYEVEQNDTFFIALRNLDDNGIPQLLTQANVFMSYDDTDEDYSDYYEDEDEDEEDTSTDDEDEEETEDYGIWDKLLDDYITIQDNSRIGEALAGSGMASWLGKVDLTKSYLEYYDEETGETTKIRLYDFLQTTKIQIATEKEGEYTTLYTIETPYIVEEYYFAEGDLEATVDFYDSDLLKDYDLEWVEEGVPIDTAVKNLLAESVEDYDADSDENTYDTEAYGIQINSGTPERWDTITITYTTIDNAYYMEDNTTYYLYCDVEDDAESGKCQLEPIGEATWDEGVISDFSIENYYTYDIGDEEYFVINITTGDDIETAQGIIGYTDLISQSLMIQDSNLYLFTGYEYEEIIDVEANTQYYIKLYTSENYIGYSTDGTNWTTTEISTGFTNYDTLLVGLGSISQTEQAPFLGSINLNNCYSSTDSELTYWFKHYKKITPYISTDGETWYSLVLTPLLTIYDFIDFGTVFSGSVDLYQSNLLLTNTIYWTAPAQQVYEIETGDWVETIIRDSLNYDTDTYYVEEETIQVNLDDLKLEVSGLPMIGDVITLTYDTYYMFRETDTDYEWHLDYEDGLCVIYYNKSGDDTKYIIYSFDEQNVTVNTGYEFWGYMDVKYSTRGGMYMSEWLYWDTYSILYRKYDEDDWTTWSTFSVYTGTSINVNTGYELDGCIHMDTSYVETEDQHSYFITRYNSIYLQLNGDVDLDDGILNSFTSTDNANFIEDTFLDGYTAYMYITLTDDLAENTTYGVCTGIYLSNGYFYSDSGTQLYEAEAGKSYVIRIQYVDGQLIIAIIGRGTTNFEKVLGDAAVITVIPYNSQESETSGNYYVTKEDDANNIYVSYRVVPDEDDYDHYLHTGSSTWYSVDLELVEEQEYYNTTLGNVYVAKMYFGNTVKNYVGTNTNPDGVVYYQGDKVEYRIFVGSETEPSDYAYNILVPYNDWVFKQDIQF